MTPSTKDLLIGVVGPCAAGKSTLVEYLNAHGYRARHIAQEHSFVQEMWRKITNPDVLIFLQVSYPVSMKRRKMDWSEKDYAEQQRRLRHAREHADLYLDTDSLRIEEVREKVLKFLETL
jgi:guanylate kinase